MYIYIHIYVHNQLYIHTLTILYLLTAGSHVDDLVLFQNFQVGFDKAKPQKMTMQKPGVYFLVLSNCGNFDQAVISGQACRTGMVKK